MMLWISSISGLPGSIPTSFSTGIRRSPNASNCSRESQISLTRNLPSDLKGDVVLESLRQPVARLLQPADGLVVLFRGHIGRGREAGEDARLASVHDRCRGRLLAGRFVR
jgi:hypothetical protein